jgi:hypothetical protein
VTVRTTRVASDGQHSHTATSWFVRSDDARIENRAFRTESEREAFLAAAFTDLKLTPVEPNEESEEPPLMAEVIGRTLAAVTFVMDYVQVQFDNDRLNYYVWPRIWRGESVLKHPAPGYNDALIGMIGRNVVGVDEVLDLGLVIELEGGARLSVPLDGTDLGGPEIAEWPGDPWIVWRPDDEVVDWLPSP